MSQKTNPTSLRLQKTNKSFPSCWYSDFFYNQTNDYDLKISSYIYTVSEQIGYLQMLSFLQNHYKRSYLHLFFVEKRGIRDERERALRISRKGTRHPMLGGRKSSLGWAKGATSPLLLWRKHSVLAPPSYVTNNKRADKSSSEKGNAVCKHQVALSFAQSLASIARTYIPDLTNAHWRKHSLLAPPCWNQNNVTNLQINACHTSSQKLYGEEGLVAGKPAKQVPLANQRSWSAAKQSKRV